MKKKELNYNDPLLEKILRAKNILDATPNRSTMVMLEDGSVVNLFEHIGSEMAGMIVCPSHRGNA